MNPRPPIPAGTRRPFVLRWLAWGLLLSMGGTLIAALIGTFVTVAQDGVDWQKLPFLLAIAIWVVLFFCLKAATNPIRSRADERPSWKEQFPNHTAQEVERFLQVAGDSLGVNEKHLRRLRPEDRVAALTQEWLCGDGMDLVELLMAIETEYELELPDSFHERDRTLGDLFAYVSQQGDARERGSLKPQTQPSPEQRNEL